MNTMKKCISILLTAAIAFTSLSLFSITAFAADSKTSFIHASGGKIVDSNGEPYLIKGMNISNDVWLAPESPPEYYVREGSYKELKQLGFNTVKFCLNYQLLESDAAPFKYRSVGFEWLEKNITWAKKYGIRMIIDMTNPGGDQAIAMGDALWTDSTIQKRTIGLWTEIARRYANEPTIIGYQLVNEPTPLASSVNNGLKMWKNLAQKIINGIRKYDKNHIVIIDRLNGIKLNNTGDGIPYGSISPDKLYPLVDDNNVMYEAHCYDPMDYTAQGTNGYDVDTVGYTYPGEDRVVGDVSWLDYCSSESADLSDNDWQYLETPVKKITDPKCTILGISFSASCIGKDGVCYGDDLVVYEYDESGKQVAEYKCSGAIRSGDFSFYSEDESGTGSVSDTVGRTDRSSLCIKGTLSGANMGVTRVKVVQGHSYKAAGYVKVKKAAPDANAAISIDMYNSTWTLEIGMDKPALEAYVDHLTSFCIKNKLAIYCGEYAASRKCYADGRGGEKWISDMLDILFERGIGAVYHDYNTCQYGFYYCPTEERDFNDIHRNEVLAKIFAKKFGGKYSKSAVMLSPAKSTLSCTTNNGKYKLSWTKADGAKKYQIQYSSDGGKTYKNAGTVSASKTSITLTLPTGGKYTFRIRSYSIIDGKKHYSEWSNKI